MKLTPVIAALRARCPYFENRVAGAAQFKNLPEVGKLRLPAAYVVPGDDSPGENKSQTDYWQELKEGFSVVVILSNGRDERGQFASYDVVDDVRQMLFKALLGWNPEACGNPITYDGGTLLDLNRHELIYQFYFSVISELTEDDTRQQDDLNSLDELQTLAIDVDYLEPGNGPDGDIEHHTEITLPSSGSSCLSNLLKGGQFLTLPAATFCPPKGEMLTRTTTGCAVKQRVISGA